MASSMMQKETKMFCNEVFGSLIAKVTEFRSSQPGCTIALYQEVICRCEELRDFCKTRMSDFTLDEITPEHIHAMEDILVPADILNPYSPDNALIDTTHTNGINPATLHLPRGIETDLPFNETGNPRDCVGLLLADEDSMDDDGASEAECPGTADQEVRNVYDETMLTVKARDRILIKNRTYASQNRSAIVHKRSRISTLAHSTARKSQHTETLEQLMEAVASTEALQQLSATFELIRKQVVMRLPLETTSLAESILYIGSLEGISPAEKLIRRYYNCQLHRRRQELRKTFTKEVTLDKMLQEAYPDRPLPHDRKSDKKRIELKNQLHAARNWMLMEERLGQASIALIPSQGKSKIWNQRVENVPEEMFEAFLQKLKIKSGSVIEAICSKLEPFLMRILQGFDRTTRFAFEDMDEDALTDWLQDASRVDALFTVTSIHEGH